MGVIVFLLIPLVAVYSHDVKGFDDSVLYNINWPGETLEDLEPNSEQIIVTSRHQEQYTCSLPKVQEKETNSNEKYEGPTALELITPLFNAKLPCSYRIETYWAYEVCHGKYIRQYHEDREGKTFKVQEFVLGRWDKVLQEKLMLHLRETELDDLNLPPPTKKIDGNQLPYFELTMGNGTLCDLNQNKPRSTTVIYVCYAHAKTDVYSLKEISICTYEIIILTPLLCKHPKYKPPETGENIINCRSHIGSPKKPYGLMKMMDESRKLRRSTDLDHIRVEFLPFENSEKDETPAKMPHGKSPPSQTESFLSGVNCLSGGTGWWKYEFCYGKSVVQFHIEKDGTKSFINLGRFNKEKHLEWIEKHPHKRPKPLNQRTQLSHYYSGGTECDKTGKERQTEVKLKCLENASSVNSVSLYLLEPRYCEYILGVESPLICNILSRADENGLVENVEEDVTFVEDVNIRGV